MSGFYRIVFQGAAGAGGGALAVVNGIVAGLDVGGGIYRGSYVEEAGQLRGTAVLLFPQGGELVTGVRVPPGMEIPIPFEFPAQAQQHSLPVSVAGHRVVVLVTKISDLG